MPSQRVGRSVSRDPAGLPPRSKNSYILYTVYTHDNICTYIIQYLSAYKLFIQGVGVLNVKTLPPVVCVTSKFGVYIMCIGVPWSLQCLYMIISCRGSFDISFVIFTYKYS